MSTLPPTIDLTSEQPAEDSLISFSHGSYRPAEMPSPDATPETPENITRERMRGTLALSLTFALGVVLVFSLIYVLIGTFNMQQAETTDDIVAVLQGVGSALLTPLVGLIGAVTGFYYGGQATSQTAAQTAAQTVARIGDVGSV